MRDDFYIGYLGEMPQPLKKFVRAAVACGLVFALIAAALAVLNQKPFANSFFDFANAKEFEGTIRAQPIPFLAIANEDSNPPKTVPLVGEGKHGVNELASQHDGARMKFRGKEIRRDGKEMIEIVGETMSVVAPPQAYFQSPETLGRKTLRGEIVDSKCFLGVMNPGNTKVHRDCAVRCISGGIPPIFFVRDNEGNSNTLWLLGSRGEVINREILDYVAEPIEISGDVVRGSDQLFFQIDPSSIRRLD